MFHRMTINEYAFEITPANVVADNYIWYNNVICYQTLRMAGKSIWPEPH